METTFVEYSKEASHIGGETKPNDRGDGPFAVCSTVGSLATIYASSVPMSSPSPLFAVFDPSDQSWMVPNGKTAPTLEGPPESWAEAIPMTGDDGKTVWAVPLDQKHVTAPLDLSERQMEVARLAASGRTYKEIAEALDISPHTARTHLRNIYRRLDIASRIELLRLLE